MRYAALYGEFTREPPAATADDATFGAWARLLIYASTLELPVDPAHDLCAGRIPGCHEWSERAWLHTTGTDRKGVDSVVSAGLARWDRADLLVDGYDMRGHRAVAANRANGQRGGRPPRRPGESAPPHSANPGNFAHNPSDNPSVSHRQTQQEPAPNPSGTPLPLPLPSPYPEERERARTREETHGITHGFPAAETTHQAGTVAPDAPCENEATSASSAATWLEDEAHATELAREAILPSAGRSGAFVGDRPPLPEPPPNLPEPEPPLDVRIVTMHAQQYVLRHAGVMPMRDHTAAKKVAQWAEENAAAYRMSAMELAAKLVSGLFASQRALANDCPLSWVAKKPTEFAPPPRAARTMSPRKAAPAVSAEAKERQERETRIRFLEQDIKQAEWLEDAARIKRLTARLDQERAELEHKRHGRQAAAE